MLVRGFEGHTELLEKLLEMSNEELSDYASRARDLTLRNDILSHSLPGLPLCWKCTVKHIGQAVGFAAELDKYPERVVCIVGELGHAYRECPDRQLAELLHETYQEILDTGCVPDLTPVLVAVSAGWRNHLHDSK